MYVCILMIHSQGRLVMTSTLRFVALFLGTSKHVMHNELLIMCVIVLSCPAHSVTLPAEN